jgi:hypothetical protein
MTASRTRDWLEMLRPVDYAGERWTHIEVQPDQILLARLRPSGVPTKVCRLWESDEHRRRPSNDA